VFLVEVRSGRKHLDIPQQGIGLNSKSSNPVGRLARNEYIDVHSGESESGHSIHLVNRYIHDTHTLRIRRMLRFLSPAGTGFASRETAIISSVVAIPASNPARTRNRFMVFTRWESILARRQGYECSVHLGPGDAGEGHAVRPKVTRLQRSVGYDAMAFKRAY
jgi:hypothetical protein